jgi:thioredoxin-related protein
MRQYCILMAGMFSGMMVLAGCEIRDQSASGEFAQAGATDPVDPLRRDDGLARNRIDFVDDFALGCQRARDERKPMLIFFTAPWCKYCHQMAQEAFAQEAVVELSRGFVCVQVDADAETGVCRQFEVRSFPTVQFVSSAGLRLNRVIGKQPANQLIAQMRAAMSALARRPDLTVGR